MAPTTYPLLTWRHTPLIAVQKKICSNMRARSSFPRATYKELAHTLGISWDEARDIWAMCDADIAARKEANNPKKPKLPKGEINLDGIEI